MINIPSTITAGDSVSWLETGLTVTVDGMAIAVTSSEYQLSFAIKGSTTGIDVVAATEGEGWRVELSSPQTASLAPGDYWVNATLSKTGFRQTVCTARLTVQADLATVSTFDGKTDAERNLGLVEAAIADILEKGVSSYAIAGRQATRSDLDQLRRLRLTYLQSIAKAQRKGRPLKISFGRTH